jgi:acyl-CoA thioester hydrolase
MTSGNNMITAEVVMQVQFHDLDPMDVVWHGNYVRYLETARCALLDKIDYNYTQMKSSGYLFPIIDLQLRYIKPAIFGQHLKITASLIEWENRLKIEYLITDAKTGQRLTRASTTQVAVEISNQAMCFASPEILLEKLRILTA